MAKMPMEQRMSILQCRKVDKSVWYTTQRPTAIHTVLRSQTNQFFKCLKLRFPFIGYLFRRVEYDLDASESVNEENSLSVKIYLGNAKNYNAYDTRFIIGSSMAVSQDTPRVVEVPMPTITEYLTPLTSKMKQLLNNRTSNKTPSAASRASFSAWFNARRGNGLRG